MATERIVEELWEMTYRLKKLPLTQANDETRVGLRLILLPQKKGKLPKSAFTNFQILARRITRAAIKTPPELARNNREWLAKIGVKRRHQDAARKLMKGDALAVIVPIHRGDAIPRMDEILRLLTGLELARQLRPRLGPCITLLWPTLQANDLPDNGSNDVLLRDGTLESISFAGGDTDRYLKHIRKTLPGTDFSPLLLDQLARSANSDADIFKARLLLRWFDDEHLSYWQPGDETLSELFQNLPLVGQIGSGSPLSGIAPNQPVSFPSVSATIIEGKIERIIEKLKVPMEALLAREIAPEEIANRVDEAALVGSIKQAKEQVLSSMLQFEMALNDLAIKPDAAVAKALTSADIGFGKLQTKLKNEAAQALEIERKQADRLAKYWLPDGRPQQEVLSLLHFLDFYGLQFLDGLREVLQMDDVRHQTVYLAED
ncbi:MAG: bacillithiol biosynthesis BshC [Planctomycetes bacterium]|nr:bacillithiol biosynthesis BshC [Planctomycetota bacterium]